MSKKLLTLVFVLTLTTNIFAQGTRGISGTVVDENGAKVAGAILAQVNIRQQARFGYGDSSDYFGSYKNYYVTNS